MRVIISFSLLLLLVATGCVSKAEANLRAREAFLAGQQQAMAQQKAQAKVVIVRGDVKNERVPWTEDMTVAKAILAADYQSLVDPKRILVVHDNKATELKPSELFNGQDLPLEPGDMVVLKRD